MAKKRIRPRGKVIRSTVPQTAFHPLGEPELQIYAWCPDPDALYPPEQVHLQFKIPGLEDMPLTARFKTPDTLGFLIEELIHYRRTVWPNCEPVGADRIEGKDKGTDEQPEHPA